MSQPSHTERSESPRETRRRCLCTEVMHPNGLWVVCLKGHPDCPAHPAPAVASPLGPGEIARTEHMVLSLAAAGQAEEGPNA